MEATVWKYKAEIDELVSKGAVCPPQAIQPAPCTAYRFVGAPIRESHFIPQGKTKPARVTNAKSAVEKCSLYSLSVYASEKFARASYSHFVKSFPKIALTLGDHLACGEVQFSHGLCTVADGHGHFEIHEYKDNDIHKAFVLVGRL